MPKRVCRGREKSWEKRTATGKSRVLRSRSGSGRGWMKAEGGGE
jgi:hypothetical protein